MLSKSRGLGRSFPNYAVYKKNAGMGESAEIWEKTDMLTVWFTLKQKNQSYQQILLRE